MVVSCPFQSRRRVQIRFVSVQFGILIITLSYELGFESSYTLWKACEIIYNFVNHLSDEGQREVIFPGSFVEHQVIDAHSPAYDCPMRN
jgi:hypothetical protein